MAAPVPTYIQTPTDSGNSGKKLRMQSRIVGPDTVLSQVVEVASPRSKLGGYKMNAGVQTVPAAVHNGTTTGFWWLINPVGSTRLLAIRRVYTLVKFNALAVDLLAALLETLRRSL